MEIEYHHGFNILRSGKPGPVFVAPHATISYKGSEREDVGSENVAFLAARKIGGTAIISSIPRMGIIGIDYNRLQPSASEVKNNMNLRASEETKDYCRTFAWTADSHGQFNAKKAVYTEFWKAVTDIGMETKKPFFIFCHTLCSRPKNMPTLIDLITGRGRWIDKEKIESITAKLNKKYNLDECKKELKEHMHFWLFLYSSFIRQNFGSLDKTGGIIRDYIKKDITNAEKILNKDLKLKPESITFEDYRELISSILEKTKLRISVEAIFHGDYAKPVPMLLKKTKGIALEVESASYLNEVRPDIVVNILSDIVRMYSK